MTITTVVPWLALAWGMFVFVRGEIVRRRDAAAAAQKSDIAQLVASHEKIVDALRQQIAILDAERKEAMRQEERCRQESADRELDCLTRITALQSEVAVLRESVASNARQLKHLTP